jgi:hypothetical protein
MMNQTIDITPNIGDTITFGKYQYIVLEVNDNKATIILENIIEKRQFNFASDNNWETCILRDYLSTEFYKGFSESERNRICEVVIKTGNVETEDKIWLLSADEARTLFLSNEARIARFNDEPTWWWLRSTGRGESNVAGVGNDGRVSLRGYNVCMGGGGVRPAMIIEF